MSVLPTWRAAALTRHSEFDLGAEFHDAAASNAEIEPPAGRARKSRTARAMAMEQPRMALAPRALLLSLPSSSSMAASTVP